ncbi:MAG: TIR domain-containing protein [Flavobacteriales bacterium]|nr:TIR domain-containing protein [Flavobacteriales bacterium]
MIPPKLFVSYSWTSRDHEAWVLELATQLRESGVDVILDKWDLKEGHDAHAFMEKMVTDPEIRKVLLICNQAYVTKADARAGGVGTEAQIISGEIYNASDQEKFVAVVKERREDGQACLPTYYKSRIYIDLSDQSAYSENFDRLLRWVHDRPLYKKPSIGVLPSFLNTEQQSVSLTTSSRFRRAIEAVRADRLSAEGAVVDYFNCLVSEIGQLRIVNDDAGKEFDDRIIESITSFVPYRNEAIELFEAIAIYRDTAEMRRALHRFFEGLIPYMEYPPGTTSFHDWEYDNFKFIVHELFLYSIAALIRHERFEAAAELMEAEYYVPELPGYEIVMFSFETIRRHMRSLEHRNSRLKLNRQSIRADMLVERCNGTGVPFRDLMQADFILFMRDHLFRPDARWHWWPETLLYLYRNPAPFEIYARSRSSRYFDRAKVLLGVNTKADLIPLLNRFEEDRNLLPNWQFTSFWPRALMAFDEINTKP